MLCLSYNGTESNCKRVIGRHLIKKYVGDIYLMQINEFFLHILQPFLLLRRKDLTNHNILL